jgi:hypothetical protein
MPPAISAPIAGLPQTNYNNDVLDAVGRVISMWRLLAIVNRICAIAGIAAATRWYCESIVAGADHATWFEGYVWLDISVGVVTGTLWCSVVLLLNWRNSVRIGVILTLSAIGAFVGFGLSDPMTWGSYDHLGGRETLQNALFLGPVGAIVGYLIATLLPICALPAKTGPSDSSG